MCAAASPNTLPATSASHVCWVGGLVDFERCFVAAILDLARVSAPLGRSVRASSPAIEYVSVACSAALQQRALTSRSLRLLPPPTHTPPHQRNVAASCHRLALRLGDIVVVSDTMTSSPAVWLPMASARPPEACYARMGALGGHSTYICAACVRSLKKPVLPCARCAKSDAACSAPCQILMLPPTLDASFSQ